jgi:CubicO group peptidase (beta-lactamase class C family)
MDYPTFLKKEIFDPCGMTDTTFTPTAEQEKRMVAMHNRVDGKNVVAPMPVGCIFEDYPATRYLGGAGLVSSLSDYAKFAKMLLNKGKTENGTVILKEKTFNQLCTPQVPKEVMPGEERWGLGVRVITEESYPTLAVGSFGWSGAYGSHFWIDPSNNLFAVYLKNSKGPGGGSDIFESSRNFEQAVYSALNKKEFSL